jgi:hypothetical protein
MKALLLYPEFPEPFWSLNHILRFIGKRAPLPALSIFTVAAMLPDKWETRMVDLTVCPGRAKDLAEEDTVLISATIAPRGSRPPMSVAGDGVVVGGGGDSSGSALGRFFDRRFGKGLPPMVVVPEVRGSGCLIYEGKCRGWRGSVVRDYRTTAWRRPFSA